ncbi:MAG TPA: ABC transporter substrate-binding protein [Acidimicrobiia bacterium]
MRATRAFVAGAIALTTLAALPALTAAPAAAQKASGEPIVLGNVGTYTSPAASGAIGVGKDSITAWAKWVNAHGGVNGHPIKLIQKDNKNDQALAVSQVKELVEQDHVVAFVSNQDGSLNSGYADYLKEKNIPVLGGSVFTLDPWVSNPMFYPQGITAIPNITALVAIAKDGGYKKLGSLACAEAAQCAAANTLVKGLAGQGGVDYVYGGLVSSTAPDYTANCLAAKDADAEILMLLIATADTGRKIADDCARQNYKPAWILPGEAIGAGYLKTDVFNNTFNAAGVLPWFSKDPAMKDFKAAMKKYTDLNLDQSEEPLTADDAWVSGLMLQKAVELSGVTGVPSSADILSGLAKFDGETLGGLAGGLTYTNPENKNQGCYFTIEIKKQKFTLPEGSTPACVATS